jgi:translocation and assembly module TamB
MQRSSLPETRLPEAPAPRSRLSIGKTLARILCTLLCVVGILPIVLAVFLKSSFAKNWATRESTKALNAQGIQAHYDVSVSLWPLGLELDDVVVDASDGGSPFLRAKRATVRPRLFALLSGKFVIDVVDIEAPTARVVLENGELKNLAIKLPKSDGPSGPFHAPFDLFAITDGAVDLTIDGVRMDLKELDVDVTTEDDPVKGSSFEVSVRAGESHFIRTRARTDAPELMATDEDTLCTLDARVRIAPPEITVRHLRIAGFADLDEEGGTQARCDQNVDGTSRLEAEISHLGVKLPSDPKGLPEVDGHVRTRVPIALASRFVKLPPTDGYVFLDTDVKYKKGMTLPDVHGHVRAGMIKLDRYRFADYVDVEVDVHDNVVTSPKAVVELADGRVTLSDVRVEPLRPGIPLSAKADVGDVDFLELMRALGVSPHAHVAWMIRSIKLPTFGGTLDPLKLDGDFTANTQSFAVYDRGADDPAKKRLIGFENALLNAHVAIRPDSLQFQRVRADLAHSHLDNAFVKIGFHNELIVDVPGGNVGLEDVTPLVGIPLRGHAEIGGVHVFSTVLDPHVEGDATIKDFALADMPYGDITAAHVRLDGTVLSLSGVKAQKNKSSYEMPSARLDFGSAGMSMDAEVKAAPMNLRDLLDVFHLNDDPRFADLDANLTGDTRFHLSLGGQEDRCGGGYISVHANPHLSDVLLIGEKFDDGDADFDLRWRDRQAGMLGASLELHSLALHKVRRERDGSTVGSVLASATIDEGGALHGNAVIEGVPLARIQTLGTIAPELDGTVSGIAQIGGTIDAFDVTVDADVSTVHVRRAELGPSQLHVTVSQDPSKSPVIGHTSCGGPIFGPFDKDAYLRDTSSHGMITVSGDMFGGEVHLDDVKMTRQKQAEITGHVALRHLALSSLPNATANADGTEGALAHLDGEVTGDVYLDRIIQNDYAKAKIRFLPRSLLVDKDGKKLLLRPTTQAISLANNALTIPPLEMELSAVGGFTGIVTVDGTVKDVVTDPKLDVSADLKPVDLGILAGVVPRLDRARGTFAGGVRITGSPSDPTIDGTVIVRDGEFIVAGLPSPISDVNIDLSADTSELRITRGSARFASGTLELSGRAPLHNLSLGALHAGLVARGLRMSPAEGISAGIDADLAITLEDATLDKKRLPRISGDVTITSFDYTRPINLVSDLNALGGGKSKRTEVEVYDPTLDSVLLDIRVRASSPMRIKNNLVETQLAIDSQSLVVSGTNQRFGLRGELRALTGGHFRLPFGSNVFDIKQGIIKFDDPTRIDPNVDLVAVTEYRRSADSFGASGSSSTRSGANWRITLHAYGAGDDLKVDLTSDPPLSQEDIVLLLTIGITRAEADQIQAGNLGTGVALEALSALSGASSAVRSAIPVIDDFRFGSAYSPRTGRTEPNITIGKRLTKDVTANVSTGFSESRELRANILWRLSQKVSVQGSYDNINNNVTSFGVGNLGLDLRFRLEFE